MSKLPQFLKQYFWDVDFNSLQFEKSKTFILKRVLEVGDIKSVNWLSRYYSKEDIKNLILASNDLSAKTATFWALYLGIDSNKVPSLKKFHLRQIQSLTTSKYLNRILWLGKN